MCSLVRRGSPQALLDLNLGFTPEDIRELVATADSDNSGYLDYAEFYTRFAEEPAVLVEQEAKSDIAAKKALREADSTAKRLDPVVEGEEGDGEGGEGQQVLAGITAQRATDDEALAVDAAEEEESTGLLLASQMNTHDIIHVGDIFPLRGGHAAVHGRNFVSTGAGFYPTVSCRGLEATSGAWFFEVTVMNAGRAVVGWASQQFRRSRGKHGRGVGDCAHSWGIGCNPQGDGATGAGQFKMHNGEVQPFGNVWQAGDVIGVMVDMTGGTISFSINGSAPVVAFTGVGASKIVRRGAVCDWLLVCCAHPCRLPLPHLVPDRPPRPHTRSSPPSPSTTPSSSR